MADAWFVKLAGTDQGPISPAQLRELVRKKVVKPETLVRKGENRWVRAGKVHGLFEAAFRPSASISASSSGIRPALEPENAGPTETGPANRAVSEEGPQTPGPALPDPVSALGIGEGAPASGDEVQVWTGLTDEEEPSDFESAPAIDLGFPIDEPTSLRDAPRPPLPISEHAPIAPKPEETTPEPPPEGPASPLGIHVEGATSLRDGPKVPKPPPAEGQTARPSETEAAETGDRAIRRVYLGRESSAASMGLLLYFQAVLMLLFTGYWTARMLDSLRDLEPGPELKTLQLSILLEGSTLLSGTGALFLMGTGLRLLQPWGRWVSATLMAEILVATLVALLSLALEQAAHLAPLAYLLLVVGVFEPMWTLYVLLSEPADVVFSTAYRELIVRTRGVHRPVSWMMVALFLLEVAALGNLGWGLYRG